MYDKGIYMAGPFATPDITKPPQACAEAVFLTGSVEHAPFYLNELLLDRNSRQLSNNGWASGDVLSALIINGGTSISLSWDLTGTGYALTYVSVNFDNNFYHVYSADRLLKSGGTIPITGNLRDPITYVRFWGIRTVPESGATAGLLGLGIAALGFLRWRLAPHLGS
ncbi:MAG: hypothetical protein DLM52_07740 [Chthoniobacterales bacterium]|nr:MAG: hypothetical protein DLM52_07740 [Chthoniobacterales bacterium]